MNQTFHLTQVLSAYPHREAEILQESDRIKKLSSECGCALGSWFMFAALGIVGAYFIFFHTFVFPKIILDLVLGLLFVFTTGTLGKGFGIGLAKWRLARLLKSFHKTYPTPGA